jgi:polysaccharide export outer membrane protein
MTHRMPIAQVILIMMAAVGSGIVRADDATPNRDDAHAGWFSGFGSAKSAETAANPAPASSGKPSSGASTATDAVPQDYRIQPGDLLTVSVWKEQDLSGDALVRPDGGLSFALVGDVAASGKSVAMLRQELTERLQQYIPNPVITVSVKAIGGNRVFVLGKVQRPGEFPFSRPVDVMQAISLAGGTTSFAALNHIVILRRENGRLRSIPFHYADVERGKSLDQNILLASGDTVVVP